MEKLKSELLQLLTDNYYLYLKTQNYHWNVKGINFKALHELFEEQYNDLALANDEIAERIRILGDEVTLDSAQISKFKISKIDNSLNAQGMINDLVASHQYILNDLKNIDDSCDDEGTEMIIDDRIAATEKTIWILQSHLG